METLRQELQQQRVKIQELHELVLHSFATNVVKLTPLPDSIHFPLNNLEELMALENELSEDKIKTTLVIFQFICNTHFNKLTTNVNILFRLIICNKNLGQH